MEIQAATTAWDKIETDWLLIPVCETGGEANPLAGLDERLGGRLTRLHEAGDLSLRPGDILEIRDALADGPRRLLFIGAGPAARLTLSGFFKVAMTAVRRVSTKAWDHVAIALPPLEGASGLGPAELAQTAAIALHAGSVGQGLYRREPERAPLSRASVVGPAGWDQREIEAAVARGAVIGEAVNLARELVNRFPSELYPETFADRARQLASEHGLECDILDEARIVQERMGSLLAVAKGSERPARVVVLEYRGDPGSSRRWGWCGKGVTFDSGGLSLKPTDGMKTMKGDMAGAAAVLAAMTAIARLKLPVNIVGVLGLVENMVSGNAYKLGDVLTARNGVTIEVLNTDAEGRLVLADVLCYTVDLGIERLVDLATLTGSCVVALGEDVSGAFTNDQAWCDQLVSAARRAGEDVWQLPMYEFYSEQLKSEVADCKNVGTRHGGSITAAKFLEKFVAGTPWVHLDIAGPAFAETTKPHREGGGTGVMVRTLVELAGTFPA